MSQLYELSNFRISCTSVQFADNKIFILKEEQGEFGDKYNVITDVEKLYFKALTKKIESGDVGVFEPLYLQLSQAERNLNDKG